MANTGARNADGFAQRLRDLRRQRKLSQTDLAQRAGLHYTHIGRYERGASRPTANALKRLAEALDVTGDHLMEGTIDELAQTRFQDRELLRQFEEVERLPDEDKFVVKQLIDAFLTKQKLKQLAG